MLGVGGGMAPPWLHHWLHSCVDMFYPGYIILLCYASTT